MLVGGGRSHGEKGEWMVTGNEMSFEQTEFEDWYPIPS